MVHLETNRKICLLIKKNVTKTLLCKSSPFYFTSTDFVFFHFIRLVFFSSSLPCPFFFSPMKTDKITSSEPNQRSEKASCYGSRRDLISLSTLMQKKNLQIFSLWLCSRPVQKLIAVKMNKTLSSGFLSKHLKRFQPWTTYVTYVTSTHRSIGREEILSLFDLYDIDLFRSSMLISLCSILSRNKERRVKEKRILLNDLQCCFLLLPLLCRHRHRRVLLTFFTDEDRSFLLIPVDRNQQWIENMQWFDDYQFDKTTSFEHAMRERERERCSFIVADWMPTIGLEGKGESGLCTHTHTQWSITICVFVCCSSFSLLARRWWISWFSSFFSFFLFLFAAEIDCQDIPAEFFDLFLFVYACVCVCFIAIQRRSVQMDSQWEKCHDHHNENWRRKNKKSFSFFEKRKGFAYERDTLQRINIAYIKRKSRRKTQDIASSMQYCRGNYVSR